MTLMLPTRSLPPPFLLPSWGARHLARVLQRAYTPDSTPERPTRTRKVARRTGSKKPTAQTPRRKSIYEELFPEESEAAANVQKEVKKLPPFHFPFGDALGNNVKPSQHDRPHIARVLEPSQRSSTEENTPQELQFEWDMQRRRREATVLVLNSASKRLEESDFLRIGSKGTHIQGWTTGILKIIQARDENTLEPLGYYFILFSSDSAARGYLDQTIRLHRLSKAYTGSLEASILPPPRGLVREGEDPNEVVKGFTLVPGQSQLSLRLVHRPYSPGVTKLLSEGGPQGIASRQSMGQGLVLLSVDLGHIRAHDLRDALGVDGKRRNLHWRLAQNPIVKVEEQPDEQGGDEAPTKAVRGSVKYILALKDRNEARRFVREWHRRPFPVQKQPGPGDEEPPMVSTQILW